MARETRAQELARLNKELKDPKYRGKESRINARIATLNKRNAGDVNKNIGGTLSKQLPPGQKQLLDTGTKVSQAGLEGVQGRLAGGAYNKDFSAGDPYAGQALDIATRNLGNYKPLEMGQDVLGDRNRIEDEVFGRLTRNTDRDYAREKEQMEQTLANRGIPLNPADPQYKANMDALNQRYDTIKADARAQATELGGSEMSRSYDIASGTHATNFADTSNLGTQGYNMASGTRAQNVNELGQLGQIGMGTKGAEEDLAYKQLEEQRRANKAAEELKRRGQGGGAAAPVAPNPFSTSTPPGT